MALPRLKLTLPSETACGIKRRGTSSGVDACQQGTCMTVPKPISVVSDSNPQG